MTNTHENRRSVKEDRVFGIVSVLLVIGSKMNGVMVR